MNLKIEENPGDDLVEVVKGAVTLGEVYQLSVRADDLIKRNKDNTSLSLCGDLRKAPPSYSNSTPAGRICATLMHYAHLKT